MTPGSIGYCKNLSGTQIKRNQSQYLIDKVDIIIEEDYVYLLSSKFILEELHVHLIIVDIVISPYLCNRRKLHAY